MADINTSQSRRSIDMPNAEPLPDWEEAKAVLSWAWGVHWITFVVLFSALAVCAAVRLLTTRKIRREKVSRNVSFAVHSLIIVLGISRTLALTLFPYEMTTNVKHADQEIPLYAHRLFFGLGFPCFTAAFALIQITFTESVKTMPLTHSKLRKVRFLILVIAGHFSVVIVASIVTALVTHTAGLYVLCSAYLLCMTLFTATRTSYSGLTIVRESSQSKHVIENLNVRHGSLPRGHPKSGYFSSKAVRKVFIITALTTVFCTALLILEIYDLVEVIRFLLGETKQLKPWPWYTVETLFRLTEVGLACTVLYAVSPYKPAKKKGTIGCCWKREDGESKQTSVGTSKMATLSFPPSL